MLAHFLPLLALSYETTHADVDHGEGGSLRFLAQEDFSLSSDLSLSVAGILPVGSGKSSIVSNVGSSKAEKSASTSFSKAGKKMKSTYEVGLRTNQAQSETRRRWACAVVFSLDMDG